MATAPQKFPALDGFLAGNFADADIAGLSDEQAAVAQLRRATLDWHRQVLREGRAALRAPHLNWRHIANYANRAFTGEKQARAWLSRMIRELERGIERV